MTDSEDFSLEFGDAEDAHALSLCNLPIHGYDHDDISRGASTSSDQELFEFFAVLRPDLRRNCSISFHGDIVDQINGLEVNEYRKRDYLCLKSASYHKARDYDQLVESRPASNDRSTSLRSCLSKGYLPPVQKVNITAITSMSATSRRRMFMFGPVKFKPEMDVRAIRKRRSRLAAVLIPPMPEEGEEVAPSSGGGAGAAGRQLVRPLWCRSHLATALAKSFGCITA